LTQLQSLLANQSAAISSAGDTLRSIRDRLDDIVNELSESQVKQLFLLGVIFLYRTTDACSVVQQM